MIWLALIKFNDKKKIMAFGKGIANVVPPTYQEGLGSVESMFRKAHGDTSKLHTGMQADKGKKLARIDAINAQIADIDKVQDETQGFMSNLEKFI